MQGVGKTFGIANRILCSVEVAAAIVAACLMLAAMVLTTLDALLRYIFNAPIVFNYYLTENYLMVGILTMPLAWGFRTGGYIRIGALTSVLPTHGRELLLRLGLFVSGIYISSLAWFSAVYFVGVYSRGDYQMGVIDWPVWLSWVWVPVGLALLALRLIFITFGPAGELQLDLSDEGDAQ